MSSITPIRNPKTDHLITPENSALIIIDYQELQVNSIASMNRNDMVRNIISLAELAKGFNVPTILSTVNVKAGKNTDTITPLKKIVKDLPTYDRTAINSWEDREFYDAVKSTERKKLVMCALWTEACLAFPALDALQENFDVYVPVDCIGGTSPEAHNAALQRMQQAGAKLVSLTQVACEWQRDWNRESTVEPFFKALATNGSFLGEVIK